MAPQAAGAAILRWVSKARHVVLTITTARLPEPWRELQAEVVAPFRDTARCLTHKCPGHPNKGPLYMALHAPHTLPSELDPALRTHGFHSTLHPRCAPTVVHCYLQPQSEPGI